MLTITVGPDKRPFHVHKPLLLHQSRFLSRAFERESFKVVNNTLHLKDIDPAIFELFLEWVYRRTLDPPSIKQDSIDSRGLFSMSRVYRGTVHPFPAISEDVLEEAYAAEAPYHELYYLAERWSIDALKNVIIDKIREFHHRAKVCIDPDFIIAGYINTSRGSPLRKYLAVCAVFHVFDQIHDKGLVRDSIGHLAKGGESLPVDLIKDMLAGRVLKCIDNPNTGLGSHPDSSVMDKYSRCIYHVHQGGQTCED